MEAHRKGWRCWFAASSYGFLWHVVIIKVGFQSALALALRASTEFIGGFKEARMGPACNFFDEAAILKLACNFFHVPAIFLAVCKIFCSHFEAT